jgi:DNA (cytosine-5)-methyltransferase 1
MMFRAVIPPVSGLAFVPSGTTTPIAIFPPKPAKGGGTSVQYGNLRVVTLPNSGNFDPTNPDIRMNPRAPRSLPRMASLFSGGGLVEAGLVGLVEPVFAVDCDAHVASAYEAAHGAHICVADVCDVALPQRGTVDYLHASPVCKTSSLAKRGSKEESTEDMKTAQATADAIRALRPEIFTLENVPGYQKSASLGLITDALREEGYTFDAHVYDAADYGAPTHRTRLLLRAVREGELPSVPKPTHPVGGQADWYASVSDIIEAMPDTAIPKARKRAEDWMSLRLRAAGVDLSRLPRPLLVLGGSTGRGIPHVFAGSPAPTLKATTGEAHRIFLPDGRVKRLTPRGMARITGLPDDYPLPSAWGLAVKVIGNGVPPALARAIFGPLLQPAQAPKPRRPRSK